MIKKYAIIFGTRPEYLKLKPLIDKFKINKINFIVIYIGQHETINEEFDFCLEKLNIENVVDERLCNIGSQILCKLPYLINLCSDVIVQGDTSTAFYSALVGFQLKKNIIHVEAGLRTYDLNKPFPEEGYRQMISRMTNIHFTPHEDSSKILIDEKVSGQIFNVGNTILDTINSYKFNCEMNNSVIITFHRRENWDKINVLLIGLKKLIEKTPFIKYIWYLHSNPELQKNVKDNIKHLNNITLMEPCSHIEFVENMSKCNFLITDSGGIQEEASFLGKYCIVLRSSTERTHISSKYIIMLEDYTKLDNIYDSIPKYNLEPCTVYGTGNSSDLITNIIEKL
jgi:UDP-N-acetylglucosamine 2-epimerase (non-hydrolysing)